MIFIKSLVILLGFLGLVGTVWPGVPGFFILLVTGIFWATVTGFRAFSLGALLWLSFLAGSAQLAGFFLLRVKNPHPREVRQEQLKALIGGGGSLLVSGFLLGPFPGLVVWETFIGRFIAEPLREGFFWGLRLAVVKGLRFLTGLFILSWLLASVLGHLPGSHLQP